MKYKRLEDKVVLRIDKGEEIVETLKNICKQLEIKGGTIIGIGATDKITIGLMNTKTKKYQPKEFIGDHEIASLIGNITTMNNEIYLHLHATICNIKNEAFGGHLTSAVVSVTFEGVIDIINGKIDRTFDNNSGMNLLNL